MEVDSTYGDYKLYDSATKGQIWVRNEREVEWYVDDICIRRYSFADKVLKAGFVDFETAKNCLIIVLEDCAHVHYLSKGDSTAVCFPFSISNAFFYSNGILLERKMDFMANDLKLAPMKHMFITMSDPLTPFGSLVFDSTLKDMESCSMLHFPRGDDHVISVIYEQANDVIHFYSAKILNSKDLVDPSSQPLPHTSNVHRKKSYGSLSSENSSTTPSTIRRKTSSDVSSSLSSSNGGNKSSNAVLSTGLTNNLRKISIMNRRSASASLANEQEHLQHHNSSLSSTEFPKRSASATFDRMGFGSALDMSPTTTSHANQELFDQSILSKDIVLTKIASSSVPIKFSNQVKTFSSKFQDKEAIVIYDRDQDWGKIWIFNLNSSIINNMKFKAFGYSPISLTRTIDIKPDTISDLCPHNSPHLKGFLTFLFRAKNAVSFYNPFLDLTSCDFPLLSSSPQIHDSSTSMVTLDKDSLETSITTYPDSKTVQHYFKAIKCLTSVKNFYYIVAIWQIARRNIVKHEHSEYNDDFAALRSTLLSFLLHPDSKFCEEHIRAIYNSPIFNREYDLRQQLPKIVMGLHLVREELQLNVLQSKNVHTLGALLHKLTTLMRWPEVWQEYYGIQGYERNEISSNSTDLPHPLDEPPSILKSLYSITDNSRISLTPFIAFSRLAEAEPTVDELITPRTHKMLRLFEIFQSRNYSRGNLLELLNSFNIDSEELETYPVGIFAPLKLALVDLENQLSSVDPKINLDLINRSDLKKNIVILKSLNSDDPEMKHDILVGGGPQLEFSKLANKTSERSKSIKTIVEDVIKNTRNFLLEGISSSTGYDQEIDDGYTLKRNAALIFSEDRRFTDAIELLLYYAPHRVELFSSETNYTNLLKKKRKFAEIVSLRTLTSGIGWGAVAFATEKPLSTQKWTRPKLNLMAIFPDGTKVSTDADSLDKELLEWGEFHGGVSSGLRISKKATGITGSWIAFNKPPELDAQHGGFLLGLGLNGHLKDLEEWHVYNYLSPKQTHTSIGLLLGMSASLKGTMDLKLTKVLSVHVVALLPPGSTDLNVNSKLQTAGLIGIGLLYQRTQHRRMSDLLFSQISSFVNVNEEPVPDEGYRLAAGVSLGLVNMGAGDKTLTTQGQQNVDFQEDDDENRNGEVDLKTNNGLMDPKIIEGLISTVISVHDIEDNSMPDNSHAGALVALMLMFLKTNNISIADKLKIPKDEAKMKYSPYIKPEIFMYREWAYNMIMWDSIGDSLTWLLRDLEAESTSRLNTDNLPIYYTLAGRIMSVGVRFASTNNEQVRDAILKILDKFLPLYQCSADERLDSQLTIKGITLMVNVMLVSACLTMCGSGDLNVFRRVKYLHDVITGRHSDLYSNTRKNKLENSNEDDDEMSIDSNEFLDNSGNNATTEPIENEGNPDELDGNAEANAKNDDENHYGKYMATNLALGFLFLGSGQYALKTTDLESLSYLIISVLPNYMAPYYLQETKHFWSMAVEPRCLVIRHADTGEYLNKVPVEITLKSTKSSPPKTELLKSPCLLPNFKKIQSISVSATGYYPFTINFNDNLQADEFFKNGCILYIQPMSNTDEVTSSGQDIESHTSNIKLALRKKLEDRHKGRTGHRESFASKLAKDLSLENQQFLELDNEIKKMGSTNVEQDTSFNLDMACSIGDTDYQLELWRKRHGL